MWVDSEICGLTQRLYYPLWNEGLPFLEEGIRGCKYLNQVVMGDNLQGHQPIFHYSDMYPSGLLTSLS